MAAGNWNGMKLEEMFLLIKDSAIKGAATALTENIKLSERITKSEAYRRYGRTSVDRWLQEGLLKPDITNGRKSHQKIDIKKLEAIAASSNRGTYLPVAER